MSALEIVIPSSEKPACDFGAGDFAYVRNNQSKDSWAQEVFVLTVDGKEKRFVLAPLTHVSVFSRADSKTEITQPAVNDTLNGHFNLDKALNGGKVVVRR
jgi:hypothetical protein